MTSPALFLRHCIIMCATFDAFFARSCCHMRAPRALETLVTEIARARLYGFSQREFNNAIKNMQVSQGPTSMF